VDKQDELFEHQVNGTTFLILAEAKWVQSII